MQSQQELEGLTSHDSTSTLYEPSMSFEAFQQSHPSIDWIQEQKNSLKAQYAKAKSLGEHANELRLEIS